MIACHPRPQRKGRDLLILLLLGVAALAAVVGTSVWGEGFLSGVLAIALLLAGSIALSAFVVLQTAAAE